MKTYASRKNARFAAEREGVNIPDIKVHEITNPQKARHFGLSQEAVGRFVWVDAKNPPPITPEQDVETRAFLRKFPAFPANPLDNSLLANFDQSTVESPVKLVHEIANSMPDARRKDVIQKCVESGIAYHTARTQYQVWFRNRRRGEAANLPPVELDHDI